MKNKSKKTFGYQPKKVNGGFQPNNGYQPNKMQTTPPPPRTGPNIKPQKNN